MSFFFDVWTYGGFVLASDVRLIVNGKQCYTHKIALSAHSSKTKCAIAVCGEYPESCINFFVEADSLKDTLREKAKHFASKWTKRYAGKEEYSAVHLVGFEQIPGTNKSVPQVWYWYNWEPGIGYLSNQRLRKDLSTFTEPIPVNNHLPWKVKQLTSKFPGPTLEKEHSLVMSFLHLYQPLFTWNGDTSFWKSAGGTVGSAMNLLWQGKTSWTIDETVELTSVCLKFLASVGNFLPESTVGPSPDGKYDMVVVTPTEAKWVSKPKLPKE